MILELLACATGVHPAPVVAPTFPPAEVRRVDRHALTRAFTRASGAPRIVSLFATWCAPCEEEVPMLERLAESRGIEVTIVSVDLEADAARIEPWLRRHAVRSPADHFVDADLPGFLDLLMPGWPRVLPVTLVVAADGTTVRRFDGYVARDQLESALPR
jgi:cytochrome c biogenesis protein CcmG/thiol:disulfide interchange protein DsbE